MDVIEQSQQIPPLSLKMFTHQAEHLQYNSDYIRKLL